MENLIDQRDAYSLAETYNLVTSEDSKFEPFNDTGDLRGFLLAHKQDHTHVYIKVHTDLLPQSP
jgi:hypothetical protein